MRCVRLYSTGVESDVLKYVLGRLHGNSDMLGACLDLKDGSENFWALFELFIVCLKCAFQNSSIAAATLWKQKINLDSVGTVRKMST